MHGNELKCFFEFVISYNNCFLKKIDNIKYIIVFERKDYDVTLGISSSGEWIYKIGTRYFILKEKKDYLFCSELLEISYFAIKEQIEERFGDIVGKRFDTNTIFPFLEIVEFAFNTLNDDYWFELAWLWYREFNFEKQYRLIYTFKEIVKNKKISQKNRQIARKKIKFFEEHKYNI